MEWIDWIVEFDSSNYSIFRWISVYLRVKCLVTKNTPTKLNQIDSHWSPKLSGSLSFQFGWIVLLNMIGDVSDEKSITEQELV